MIKEENIEINREKCRGFAKRRKHTFCSILFLCKRQIIDHTNLPPILAHTGEHFSRAMHTAP